MYRRNNRSRYARKRNYGSNRFRTKTFDPRTVIGKMTSPVFDAIEVKNRFSDFDIERRLFDNIQDHKFDAPTPIQDRVIPEILLGRDVVGIANTGTGKTAAFLIPLINKVCKNRGSKILIIAPTRELAVQIEKELQSYCRGLGIYSAICIGGVSIRGQIYKLQKRPNFVIGTPGRLLDLESQRKINFGGFQTIVLDEVDRMLDMGFIHDINKIISKLPKVRQSLFFSATLDVKVKGVMGKFITNPVMISVKTSDACENVHQGIVEVRGRNKADVLRELLDKEEVSKTLIFTRTKRGADGLHRTLSGTGFQAAVLHGNRSQNQRQRSLDQFGQGRVNVLIATDVASRGIDVDDISHVVNYDLPESYETYIHRIGRTGRANKKGTALTFIG